jgi:hypothetical protein
MHETLTKRMDERPRLKEEWKGARVKVYDHVLHVQVPGRRLPGSETRDYGCVIDQPIPSHLREGLRWWYHGEDTPVVKSLATQSEIYVPCRLNMKGGVIVEILPVNTMGQNQPPGRGIRVR